MFDAKAASGGEEGIYRDTGVFPSGDATAVPWRTRRPLVGLGMEPLTKLVNVCIEEEDCSNIELSFPIHTPQGQAHTYTSLPLPPD